MCRAFPLFRALGKPAQLSKVQSSGVEKAYKLLFGNLKSNQLPEHFKCDADGFSCEYNVNEYFSIPMTFVGSCEEYGDQAVLAHVPGLNGAFPVLMDDLSRYRRFFRPKVGDGFCAKDENAHLALLCATEAVATGIQGIKVLDYLLSVSRRRLASLRGVEALIDIGGRVNVEALQLSFPYHCGNEHALKRYYDITQEACSLFGCQMKHGAKILCRYGVAVFVGITPEKSLGCPAPFWNPTGAPAACLAPMFNGCRTLCVGEVKLEYNGPSPNSPLLIPENPTRYLNPTLDGKYDVSSWLNEGLFGVKVGQTVENDCIVHGVCYNVERFEFELHVKELSTGEVRPSVCSFF